VLRNPALQVAFALVAGFLAGLGLRGTPIPAVVEPIGTLWINAIRMPVLPLIVFLLIAAIGGSRDTRRIGALGIRSLAVIAVLLSVFAAIMTPLAPALLGNVQFDPASTASLREAARFDPAVLQSVSLRDWVLSLVPNNPIRSAADGALLPLVVFSVAYGLALAALPDALREPHVRFCQGVADAMTVVIRWVIVVAPIGVFALAMSVGTHLGIAAAGAIVRYIVTVAACLTVALGVLYVITVRFGRVSLRTFAAAMLPAQTIAFTSRSSLAALPVLIADARRRLRLSESVVGFVLPLGASIFKLNSPISWPLGAVLVAQLYGVDFSGASLVIFAIGSVVLALTTPGIPSGGFFVQAPLYLQVGLPPEGIGILIAIDFVPDLFKTTLNVTSYASVALIVSRDEERPEKDPAGVPGGPAVASAS
jgi:Na+/H+-dicarboxylate symporter